MKIKEVEELSGMTRANIRFYEKEGLLSPQRKSNGYRDYTEEDVETLKRIRLLRSIHISLEDIRTLNENVCELTELLPTHLIKLKEKNSNNEDDKSIESKENTKQVFGEKNNDLDELKDGLVEILDISIETIQID